MKPAIGSNYEPNAHFAQVFVTATEHLTEAKDSVLFGQANSSVCLHMYI